MLNSGVRLAFNRAATGYDAAAATQRTANIRLVDYLDRRIPGRPERILDAGAGTGIATPLLNARWPGAEILALDFAEGMLTAGGGSRRPICGDLERLPLADASIDLYWSVFALQWCRLDRAFGEAARVLRPDGALALGTLADSTFAQLDAAFANIDRYRHTLHFLSVSEIIDAARAFGFTGISTTRFPLTEYHPDLRTLLRSVKATGANQVSGTRRPGLLGRSAFRAAESRYEHYRTAEGLPLVYDVILLTARRA